MSGQPTYIYDSKGRFVCMKFPKSDYSMNEDYLKNYREWDKAKNPPRQTYFSKIINWIREHDAKVREKRKNAQPQCKESRSTGLCLGLLFIFAFVCFFFGLYGAIACVIILLTLIFGTLIDILEKNR